MAEYGDAIKKFKRMCWYYSRDKTQKTCPMCASYPNCNIGQCRKIAFERPANFESIVTQWAVEHPEPVYPSWWSYLESIGVLPHELTFAQLEPVDGLLGAIPADIAQKLGIQPKEDAC